MKRNILIIAITLTFAIFIILAILEVAREVKPAVQEPVIIEAVMPTPKPTPTPPTKRYIGTFLTHGYDICMECCGKVDGIGSSGIKAVVGVTVAADSRIFPIGTKLEIEGIGVRTVQDVGGAIKGRILDILCENHAECYKTTSKSRKVWIIEGSEDINE